ncbi:MAG: DUF4080 domain-containing protein [Clostridia bacterium]|nr:DUF4080 domain-containing protein [Clostridia bacterium]MBR3797255.1 DUF4080 domain-containing protein [Clostridia bacterium]
MHTFQVSLVGIHSRYIHSALAPWCLLSGIRTYGSGVEARVVEGTVNESDDALFTRLTAQAAEAVCFSCYIWNITTVLRLAERLKAAAPMVRIVLGGPEVSYRAAELLARYPFVDCVIAGEGERPLAAYLTACAAGESVVGLPGVCTREHVAEPYVTNEIPPSPYVPEYFEALGGRMAYLETSRGCPFSCAFCLSGRCGTVRFYPEERAFAEILQLANSGTATVKFVDRTFNADKQRALRIWRFIVENYGTRIPKGVCFHFEIAGDLLDEEMLTVLCEAPAGLFQLEIGLQSFHAETLAAVCRRTDTARLTQNIRHLLACNTVAVHLDLIAGLPEEDLPTCLHSFRTAYALRPHQLQLGFLKRLHGSPLAEDPARYPGVFAAQPPYEVRRTPWLSEDDLHRLHVLEEALDRLYNSGRFPHTLAYLTDTVGLDPVAVFSEVGAQLPETPPSLDELTVLLWELYAPRTDKAALRDALLHDRMAGNPAGVLPPCLDEHADERRRLKRLLDTDVRLRRPEGVRRGTALLSDGTLLYADHTAPHPVTRLYPVRYFREEQLGRKRQYLLFDLDGTLTDPALGITRSVQFALRRFGIDEPDLTKLQRFIGPPLLDSFCEFYGMTAEQSREALAAYREYYAVTGIYENEVYAGIPELLHDARRAGYHVIMATSKPEMYACRLMQHFGLTQHFTCIAGADMGEKRADKTAVILSAMEREGLHDPTEAVMIGDRCFDVEGGRRLGMATVGVLYGYGSREELTASGADAIAATVEELRALIIA